jgi:DHA1 family tetracycline resistance protein-like MFS transporter
MASKPNAGLYFILVTIVLDAMGLGLIIPVLPKLIIEFADGNETAGSQYFGVLLGVYSLMMFLFSPLVGTLSDRLGRRPVLLVSLSGQGLDYLLMAFAPGLGWFALGRVLSGITGASITTAQAYIADVTPAEGRAKAFGMIGAAFGVGFILGPAIGGLLGGLGLRAPFMVAAALALLNALYGWFVLPESLAPERRSPKIEWRKANPFGALLFLGRVPAIRLLIVMFFFMMLAGQVMPSTWVLFTDYVLAWEEWQTGLSLAYVGLLVGLVQGGLTGPIVKRLGEPRAALAGVLLQISALILLGFAAQSWMLLLFTVPYMLGGIAGPSVQAMLSVQVSSAHQGKLQGAVMSMTSLAAFLAPIFYTQAFSRATAPELSQKWPGVAFWVAAGFLLIALLVGLSRLRRFPKVQRLEDPAPALDAPSLPLGPGAVSVNP